MKLGQMLTMGLNKFVEDGGLKITRVPGGWIYRHFDYDLKKWGESTFVPLVTVDGHLNNGGGE